MTDWSSWNVEDSRAIEVMFEGLMKSIAASDPEAITFASRSTHDNSHGSLTPSVDWSPDQLEALRQAVWAQIRILVARTRAGDLSAYRALATTQGSPLLTAEQVEQLRQTTQDIEGHYDTILIQSIRTLLSAARAGDDATLKAAADICREEGFSMGEILPDDMSPADLERLVDRYRENAASQALPPLQDRPFDSA